jgi:hypothetical protein
MSAIPQAIASNPPTNLQIKWSLKKSTADWTRKSKYAVGRVITNHSIGHLLTIMGQESVPM